ncbi:MAG: glycosyltransferase family 2 protein [Chloroflexi bacterium]|nr:glycosyltransferase family 2 protein [Chloroflexota bacterium]
MPAQPHKPRVSLGMPVYNGEAFLESALNSVLGQTYQDFELIISDNASTDRTQAICEAYAARDPRIKYYRQPQNRGATWNFNHTVALASGEYFKWAAHDDDLAPDYLERCVKILDEHPEVVVAFSRSRAIYEPGGQTEDYPVVLRTFSPRPHVRLYDLLWREDRYYQVFGLMRMNVLKRTRLIENYAASDRVLMVGLAMFGQFSEIPEFLFFPRKHLTNSVRTHLTRHTRMIWFDPTKQGKVVMPAWELFMGYLRSVLRAPLTRADLAQTLCVLARWTWRERRVMLEDLYVGAKLWWGATLLHQPTESQPHMQAARPKRRTFNGLAMVMALLSLLSLTILRVGRKEQR